MNLTRKFCSVDFMQASEGEPIRSVVCESSDAVIVAWYVKPGQTILPHIHPKGQDTWIILSGQGQYRLDQTGTVQAIKADDVLVARTNDVHGVFNDGTEALVFISVVSPADAGYQLITNEVDINNKVKPCFQP